jgi:hypothetical protein
VRGTVGRGKLAAARIEPPPIAVPVPEAASRTARVSDELGLGMRDIGRMNASEDIGTNQFLGRIAEDAPDVRANIKNTTVVADLDDQVLGIFDEEPEALELEPQRPKIRGFAGGRVVG